MLFLQRFLCWQSLKVWPARLLCLPRNRKLLPLLNPPLLQSLPRQKPRHPPLLQSLLWSKNSRKLLLPINLRWMHTEEL